MENKGDESIDDVDMNTSASDIVFDNPTILKEFGNIINAVKEEDFLKVVPKAKLRQMKWVQTFNCLKQGIFDDMVQELNSMWKYENMPEKLEMLQKQKEKFSETDVDITLWRPQLGNVKAQLKAHDAAHLQEQKKLLENLSEEYEIRLSQLKKSVSARRGYLKALQLDINKYQKKNEDLVKKIDEKLENHDNMVNMIAKSSIEDVKWSLPDINVEIERDST